MGHRDHRCYRALGSIALVLFTFSSCKQSPVKLTRPATQNLGQPQVRTTVLTIRTTILPANKTLTHQLTFTADRARSSDELDSWRLFDLKKQEVTFVDDIARTYRTEAAPSLLAEHRRAIEEPLQEKAPRARIESAGSGSFRGPLENVMGREVTRYVISVGAYRRELVMATRSSVPEGLFAMMLASRPPGSKLAGMTRDVDEELLALRGFPVVDRTELPFDNGKKYVVEHSVIQVEQKSVPEAYLSVSDTYQKAPSLAPAEAKSPKTSKR